MYGPEFFGFSFWWVCPILMIAGCFFMMRRRNGSILCGYGFRGRGRHHISPSDSAIDILDKRYATGEIDKEEWEDKKKALARPLE